jgi:hypothetical protein
MNFDSDFLTRLSKQVLDILLLSNPFRTSMGLLFGVILWGFMPAFSPVIKEVTRLDFSSVHPVAWVCFGVFTINLKALLFKRKIPRRAEETLALIEEARKAGISDLEIKQKYKFLIQKYADNVGLNQKTQKELEQVKRKLQGID